MSRIGVLVSDAEINTISAEIPLDSHAPASDILDCNASTSAHGLLPKLSGVVGEVLRGDGTWGTGGSGAPTPARRKRRAPPRPRGGDRAGRRRHSGASCLDVESPRRDEGAGRAGERVG